MELETSAVPLENLKAEKYPPIIKKLEEKNGNISAAVAESESSTLEDNPQTYAYKKTLEALRKRTTMIENKTLETLYPKLYRDYIEARVKQDE